MLSDCRRVVVLLTARIQCATGLTDQLVESVCSNVYIVYLRLNMMMTTTMTSYFLIMCLLVCTHTQSTVIFCNFDTFRLPEIRTRNCKRLKSVYFDSCLCSVDFLYLRRGSQYFLRDFRSFVYYQQM